MWLIKAVVGVFLLMGTGIVLMVAAEAVETYRDVTDWWEREMFRW
jgi:hypothetical protein